MVGLVCFSFFLLWLIIRSTLFDLIHQQTHMFGSTIASQAAQAAGELLLAEDSLALKVLAKQFSQSDAIIRVQIISSSNIVVADSRLNADAQTYPLDQPLSTVNPYQEQFISPILYQDVIAGQVRILIDKTAIAATLQRTLSWMALTLLLVILLTAPIAYFLARYWAEPIKQLTHATSAINAGALETRLTNDRLDEFGVLLNSFNEMAHSLQEREKLKATFYRYVGSGIANQVLIHPGEPIVPLRSIDATVVFFDIVSFTRLCQHLSAQSIAQVLNQYYACVQMCCAEFGGIVDKYIGDGALVVFGADNQTPDHAKNALQACHLFLMVWANQLVYRKPCPTDPIKLDFRVALHSGPMMAGTLGHKDRLQYTVIGDTVNVAARLCQQAPINQPIMSEQSFQEITALSTHNPSPTFVESLGQWLVRGRDEKISVFASKELPETMMQQVQQRKQLLSFQLVNKPAVSEATQT